MKTSIKALTDYTNIAASLKSYAVLGSKVSEFNIASLLDSAASQDEMIEQIKIAFLDIEKDKDQDAIKKLYMALRQVQTRSNKKTGQIVNNLGPYGGVFTIPVSTSEWRLKSGGEFKVVELTEEEQKEMINKAKASQQKQAQERERKKEIIKQHEESKELLKSKDIEGMVKGLKDRVGNDQFLQVIGYMIGSVNGTDTDRIAYALGERRGKAFIKSLQVSLDKVLETKTLKEEERKVTKEETTQDQIAA